MGYHAVDWVKAAEYSWRQWMSTPLVQNLLRLQGEYAAMAAEARLAAGMAQLRTSSLLIASGSLVLTLVVPIAVWVGVFAAMGAPYAQARALVKNENFQSGFSRGFIMGLLKWEWQHVVSRFFRFGPGQINPFDESLSYIAANAYNDGLRGGFTHARVLEDAVKKEILSQLKSLSPGTAGGQWSRLDQISYVTDLAAAGRRNNFFRAA